MRPARVAIAQISVFAANLEGGVRAERDLGYPKRTPKKLRMLLDVYGRPWSIGDAKEPKNKGFPVVSWKFLDVPGRLWKPMWLPGPDSKSLVNC
jgi:hypothetical protein